MKKVNDHGFTLVELMVVVTVITLIGISVTYLISFSSRNFRKVQEEVVLQVEAQTIINQLSDLILESYNVKFQSEVLTIYHDDAEYIITFEPTNQRLMYEKVKNGEEENGEKSLYGQYVSKFEIVDTNDLNSNPKIQVSIDLKKSGEIYSIHGHIVTIRNRIRNIPSS